MMKKILVDAHTHTVASGHAYSSLQEMVKAAADKGLEVLGITEHGPSVPGTCPLVYFRNMFVVPRKMYGVQLLMGCEVNILDNNGGLDLTEEYLDRLDIVIAGIHTAWYQGGTKDENTEGLIKIIGCQGSAHLAGSEQPLVGSCATQDGGTRQQSRNSATLQEIRGADDFRQ